MREPLRMSQSPVETFQHIIGAKYEIGHIHEGKRFSLTLTNSSHPQGGTTAQCPRSPSQTVICPAGRKWECVSEHPVSPAVWEAAKKAHFSLSLSRVLKSELHNWGTVSIWAWNGIYQRDTDDTNYIRNSTGRLTTSHWGRLTCRSPGWPTGTCSTLWLSWKHTSTPWPTLWAWS